MFSAVSQKHVVARQKHILIVDDDFAQRDIAGRRLSKLGYITTSAPGTANAIALMDFTDFDLIITDFNMPGGDGLEFIKALRANSRSSKIPIILVTGGDSLSTVNAAYRGGVTDFALKPVSWNILEIQIKRALEEQDKPRTD